MLTTNRKCCYKSTSFKVSK